MAKRKSTGKRLRFEIFKRDGFTCQYCGAQPPACILVIDHIQPVSTGGDNDPMNLITACETCNQGKSDRTLGNVSPKPDADLELLSLQQEIAELKKYQREKVERDLLVQETVLLIQNTWCNSWNDRYPIDFTQVEMFLSRASPYLLEQAIKRAATHSGDIRDKVSRIKYTWGVIKRMQEEAHQEYYSKYKD